MDKSGSRLTSEKRDFEREEKKKEKRKKKHGIAIKTEVGDFIHG